MDIDVVAENLTELLTNTVNMTSVFYDVFLNPTPMDVEIQQYDDNNELITVTIPNRAKDKQIAKDGEGSPEGAVDGPIGSAYVDTLTDNIYFKTSGSDAYGWTLVLNQRMAEDLMASYLEANGYLKYSDVTRTLSASSTHSQIPSAKAVYDFVEDEIQSYIGPPDEETNIFNLKNKITNCILKAPNGVMTFSGSTITVYSGLALLIPGGRNDDGTLSNSVYTIETNLTFTYPESFASAKDIIFLTSEDDIIRIESEHVYKVQSYSNLSSLDDESDNIICYVKDDNEWYSTNDNGESWSTLSGVPIGYAIVDSEAGITDLVSYNTVRLLTEDDLEKVNIPPARNVGETVYSLLPIKDARLHLLDGSVIEGTGIYKEFVDYIADLYNENPSANYFTSEEDWQASVTEYGVCGKFVYNSLDNYVKLPKVTGFLEGTLDENALGDLIEAGLPQHTHTRGTMEITGGYSPGNGASKEAGLYGSWGSFWISSGTPVGGQNSGGNGGAIINFSASRNWTGSTSIANYDAPLGTSTTVQPQSVKGFLYIVVANSVENEVEVNINAIASDLNGKADKDLSNTDPSRTFITNISSNLVPDYENVIEVTAGAFGQWTQVLQDSFVCACGTDPYTETFWGYVSPDGGTTKYVVGRRYDDTNSNTQVTSFTFVVPKNWYFTCDAEEGGQYYIYPLKGVN